MLLTFLAFCGRASVFFKNAWEDAKATARTWLGPAPQNLLLLADGSVIPADTAIPDSIRNTAYLYDIDTQRITVAGVAPTTPESQESQESQEPQETGGRFRRLPYVAMTANHPIVGNTDISDWLGEIRANPVPNLHAKQILSLWSAVHRVYIPHTGDLRILITKSDGTDAEFHYE